MKLAKGFPVISVTGPRQSGKTTLVKATFPRHTYINLENLDTRLSATEDPRRFLRELVGKKVILDEVQRTPELFSYLQEHVDNHVKAGGLILTGSQNFLLLEGVTQTLAGRTAVEHLLPFEQSEVGTDASLDETLLKGSYPPLFDRDLEASDFYPAYLETYVERDVRSVRNIGNLALFRKCLQLCAGRTGQLLNLSALGNEVGVDHKTIQAWISVLEASFILFLLRPHHQNWNKRVVKQPKLYFLDSGVVCSLLGIRKAVDLAVHPLRGSIFETYVIADAYKSLHHRGIKPPLSFWRDHSGNEVDLLVEAGGKLDAYEVKSGETVTDSFFHNLRKFQEIADGSLRGKNVVYGGEHSTSRKHGKLQCWRKSDWDL